MCAIIPAFTYPFCSSRAPAPPAPTPRFLIHQSKENVPTLTALLRERKINTSFAFVHSGRSPRRPLDWMWVFLLLLPGLGSGPRAVLLTRVWGWRRQEPGCGWQWISCKLEGRNKMVRACRKWGGGEGKLGRLRAGGLGQRGHTLSWAGRWGWSPYSSALSKHLWRTVGDVYF